MKIVASHKLAALLWIFILQFCVQTPAFSQSVLNYQGRVISGGTAFNGTGQFKFAIVSSDGSTIHWKNDGTTTAEAPATAVSLPVNKGLFSVRLGDAAIVNMGAINSSILLKTTLKLRVWFSDGVKGWQQFAPDQMLNNSNLRNESSNVIAGIRYLQGSGGFAIGYVNNVSGTMRAVGFVNFPIRDPERYFGKFSLKMKISIYSNYETVTIEKNIALNGDRSICEFDLDLDVRLADCAGARQFSVEFNDGKLENGSPAHAENVKGIVYILGP